MLNKIIIQGNLTGTPRTQLSKNGSDYCDFTIANNNPNGTTFVNCVAFGGVANFITQYFDKGKQILISGRLEITEKDKKHYTSVIVDSANFCGNKNNQ